MPALRQVSTRQQGAEDACRCLRKGRCEMIGRGRYQQGRVSGVLLGNVCVIASPSGTAFHVVPEGADGPAFCRHMVQSYAGFIAPARPASPRTRFAGFSIHFCRRTFELTVIEFRRQIGAK